MGLKATVVDSACDVKLLIIIYFHWIKGSPYTPMKVARSVCGKS